MIGNHVKIEKLAGPDGDGERPYCNDNGLFIGSGIALVTRGLDPSGKAIFLPRPQAEIDQLLTIAYGATFDSSARRGGLEAVAKALNAGDMARAAIAALHLRLEPFPAGAKARLAKYSSDQPRDWHGRWTSEGATGSSQSGAETGLAAHSLLADAAPTPTTSDDASTMAGRTLDLCIELCWRLLERRQPVGSGRNESAFRRCVADCKLKLG